ncbi:hypothetical protein [Falsochrobactrum tianjinense]|nr:hypothetical protein [Falsochrobactrum sp. TDYN1]
MIEHNGLPHEYRTKADIGGTAKIKPSPNGLAAKQEREGTSLPFLTVI